MKKLFTLIICIYSTIQLMAQDDLRKLREGAREVKNTAREVKVATKETKAMTNEFKGNKEKDESSPAKSYIKKFWEYVEKMEAAPNDLNILGTNSRAAAATINNIKIKDKSYDVSPLEAELEKWQQAYEDAKGGKKDQRQAQKDLNALLILLYNVNTNIAGGKELETKPLEIEKYKAKTTEMVAMSIDPNEQSNASFIKLVMGYIKRDLLGLDYNIKNWETNMNMMIDEDPTRSYYMMLQYELAHWDALRKGPFAEKAQLEAGYQKVADLMKRIGSLEDNLAKGKTRSVELLKNTKMPPALVQNAEMEKLFRQTFEDAGWGETIIKINLLDRDWKAIRNEITGVVEARTQRAAIASKDKTGAYTLYNYFTIQQDYLGSGYSSQAKIIYHESTGILPENIK